MIKIYYVFYLGRDIFKFQLCLKIVIVKSKTNSIDEQVFRYSLVGATFSRRVLLLSRNFLFGMGYRSVRLGSLVSVKLQKLKTTHWTHLNAYAQVYNGRSVSIVPSLFLLTKFIRILFCLTAYAYIVLLAPTHHRPTTDLEVRFFFFLFIHRSACRLTWPLLLLLLSFQPVIIFRLIVSKPTTKTSVSVISALARRMTHKDGHTSRSA